MPVAIESSLVTEPRLSRKYINFKLISALDTHELNLSLYLFLSLQLRFVINNILYEKKSKSTLNVNVKS